MARDRKNRLTPRRALRLAEVQAILQREHHPGCGVARGNIERKVEPRAGQAGRLSRCGRARAPPRGAAFWLGAAGHRPALDSPPAARCRGQPRPSRTPASPKGSRRAGQARALGRGWLFYCGKTGARQPGFVRFGAARLPRFGPGCRPIVACGAGAGGSGAAGLAPRWGCAAGGGQLGDGPGAGAASGSPPRAAGSPPWHARPPGPQGAGVASVQLRPACSCPAAAARPAPCPPEVRKRGGEGQRERSGRGHRGRGGCRSELDGRLAGPTIGDQRGRRSSCVLASIAHFEAHSAHEHHTGHAPLSPPNSFGKDTSPCRPRRRRAA